MNHPDTTCPFQVGDVVEYTGAYDMLSGEYLGLRGTVTETLLASTFSPGDDPAGQWLVRCLMQMPSGATRPCGFYNGNLKLISRGTAAPAEVCYPEEPWI